MGLSELADLSCLYRLCLGLYNESVLTFNVSINWAEFVILVIPTQDKHPFHVRSVGQIDQLTYKLTNCQQLPNTSTHKLTVSSTYNLFNVQTYKLTNSSTHNLFNVQTYQLTTSSTHNLINVQAYKLTTSPTYQLTTSSTHNLTNSKTNKLIN